MYRILSAVVFVLFACAPQTQASGRPDKPDLEPSYSLNHGIFIAQISPSIGDFAVKYRPIFESLHTKLKPQCRSELIAHVSNLLDLYAAEISNIEGLYFKYLRQQKVVNEKEKKVPEQLLYYLKNNQGSGSPLSLTAKKKEIIEVCRDGEVEGAKLSELQLCFLIIDLCSKVMSKKIEVEYAQRLPALGTPYFDFGQTVFSSSSTDEIAKYTRILEAYNSTIFRDYYFRSTFDTENAGIMKLARDNIETVQFFNAEVQNQSLALYFDQDAKKKLALYIATACAALSGFRTQLTYMENDNWVQVYKMTREAQLQHEKKTKAEPLQPGQMRLKLSPWLEKASTGILAIFQQHQIDQEQVRHIFSLISAAETTELEPEITKFKVAMEGQVNGLKARIASLEKALEKAKRSNNNNKGPIPEGELATQLQKVKDLNSEIQNLKQELKTQTAQLKASQDEVGQLKERADRAETKLAKTLELRQEAEDNKKALAGKLKEKNQEFQAAQTEAKKAYAAEKAAQQELAQLKEMALLSATEKASLASALQELAQMKAAMAEQKSQMDTFQTTAKKAEAAEKTAQLELAQLKAAMAEQKSQMDAIKGQNLVLVYQKAELEAAKRTLALTNEQLTGEKVDLTAVIKEKDADIVSLGTAKQRLEQALQALAEAAAARAEEEKVFIPDQFDCDD